MFLTYRTLAVAITAIALSAASHAAPVLEGTITNPTGIDGLVVNGLTYDVTFSTQSYADTFASAPPTFFGSIAGAAAAVAAIDATLNAAGVSELGDFKLSAPFSSTYNIYVPEYYSSTLHSLFVYESYFSPGYQAWISADGAATGAAGGISGGSYNEYAVFSVPAVPEPSTVLLMGVGLTAISLRRTGRKS